MAGKKNAKSFPDLIKATTDLDAGMLENMHPWEVITKLQTIQTSWVRKIVTKGQVVLTKNRS